MAQLGLRRYLGVVEIVGSNPAAPIKRGGQMAFVYILKSQIDDRYYVGSTRNVEKRLKAHNSGKTKSIKAFRPFVVAYKEEYKAFSEAIKRERQIKSKKSRGYIESLISKNESEHGSVW
jgi:putative endonuclease